ncbi:MAG: ribonuclease III [Lachnospiraceae bacterium]|nr:ribonuclease III [Lachnospiraceae bacterium]
MNRNLDELMTNIGYQFKDKELLRHALTHSSYANEKNLKPFSDNERLEFLGDAVLEVVSSDFLYKNYPQMHEGDLSKLRASLVCEPTLAFCAKEINLGDFIRLGRGEDATGGRKRKSVTSDAFEAVIGAMYLDGGMEPASTFIRRFVLTDIEHKKLYHDCKTALQEIVQAKHDEPLEYEVINESGPDHAKVYTAVAKVGEEILGTGNGSSKKHAEQEAAFNALVSLHEEDRADVLKD